jgi:hypothetical protein
MLHIGREASGLQEFLNKAKQSLQQNDWGKGIDAKRIKTCGTPPGISGRDCK